LKINTREEQKLTEQVEIDSKEDEASESSEGIDIKEKDLHDLTIPAVITLPEQKETGSTTVEFYEAIYQQLSVILNQTSKQ